MEKASFFCIFIIFFIIPLSVSPRLAQLLKIYETRFLKSHNGDREMTTDSIVTYLKKTTTWFY